jgi:hypothetical protein
LQSAKKWAKDLEGKKPGGFLEGAKFWILLEADEVIDEALERC